MNNPTIFLKTLFLLIVFSICLPTTIDAQLLDPSPKIKFANTGFYACVRNTDQNNDGSQEELRSITEMFNEACQVIERIEIESGDSDVYEKTTFEYDGAGRIIKITEEEDSNYDGMTPVISETKMEKYTYVSGKISEIALDEDGSLDTIRFTYTITGGKITEIVRYDTEDINTETYTYTYDGSGRLMMATEEETAFDDFKKTTYTYDGFGRLSMSFEEEDESYDGITFMVTETEKITYTYNGSNSRVTMVLEEDDNSSFPLDGIPDDISKITYTYDLTGNITKTVEEGDENEAEIYEYCDTNCVVVPTMSQWGIIALSMIMLIIGVVVMKEFIPSRLQSTK